MPLVLSGSSGLSGNVGVTTKEMLPAGSVLQVVDKLYTETFATSASQTARIPVTNFYADIVPQSTSSRILVMASLSVGFSSTPEWSWFVDRTVGGTTTFIGATANVGNRMRGYHGGPQDGGHVNEGDDLYSFSHNFVDLPNTTSSIRYQVCLQDLWTNYTAKYVNRTGNDADTGYTTRGSSSLILMEIKA
jgi:hypothetical protein